MGGYSGYGTEHVLNSNGTLGRISDHNSLIAQTTTINSNSDLFLNADLDASDAPLPTGLARRNAQLQ